MQYLKQIEHNGLAMHSNFNDLKTKRMTPEQIAKKYVYGMHDSLTDNQEIKDMITDIETYAKEYHQAKLKLLGIGGVVRFSECKCDEECKHLDCSVIKCKQGNKK